MVSRFFLLLLCLFLIACSGMVSGSPSSLNVVVFEQSDHTFLIPDAMIYADGQFSGKTDPNGTYNLSYPVTPPVLKVTKAGYTDWTGTPSANDTAVLVPLQVRNCTYTIQVFDSDSVLPVPDATVILSSSQQVKNEHKTGSNGTVILPLRTEQAYTVEISAKGYQPYHDTIVTGFENKEVQYSLTRNDRISIMVTDAEDKRVISDAQVMVDNKVSGKTNDKGILITNLTRDEDHAIEITSPGYETFSAKKSVGANDLILEIELNRLHSTAFVSVYDPEKKPISDAVIDVDNAEIGKTNQYGRLTIPDLELKNYQVSASKDGYGTASKKVAVSEGTNDIILDLSPLNVSVLVEVRDTQNQSLSNASVLVDGVVSGATGVSGETSLSLKDGRTYLISAEKAGYHLTNNSTSVAVQGKRSVLLHLEEEKKPAAFGDIFLWGVVGGIILIGGAICGVLAVVGRNRRSGRQRRRSSKKRSL